MLQQKSSNYSARRGVSKLLQLAYVSFYKELSKDKLNYSSGLSSFDEFIIAKIRFGIMDKSFMS